MRKEEVENILHSTFAVNRFGKTQETVRLVLNAGPDVRYVCFSARHAETVMAQLIEMARSRCLSVRNTKNRAEIYGPSGALLRTVTVTTSMSDPRGLDDLTLIDHAVIGELAQEWLDMRDKLETIKRISQGGER